MKLFNIEVERSYWRLTIGVVMAIYLWFFFMAISKFVEIKNERILKTNTEELQSLKEQIVLMQRLKSDAGIYPESIPDFPAGYSQLYTPHFLLLSYNEQLLNNVVQYIEQIYSSVISDTNLYNFNPFERYTIYIYKDSKDYKEKTKRPEWSGGYVSSRKIYTYESDNIKNILSHEVTHLIFNDFLATLAEKIPKWIHEGLAIHQEKKFSNLKTYPFDKMNFLPADEFLNFDLSKASSEKVNIWYLQSGSIISFMLDNYPKEHFYNFILKLKETANIDNALSWGYQSRFNNFSDLEAEWHKGLSIK